MPLIPNRLPPYVTSEFHPPLELLKGDDVSLPQAYDWNAINNPHYPLFVYHDGKELRYVTYSSINRAIDQAARYILGERELRSVTTASAQTSQPTIAIFADTESISYVCTAIGIMRAGCIAFFISTRNGPAAVADMLRRTGTIQLLVSPDSTTEETAQKALAMLPERNVTLREMPSFEMLFVEESGDGFENGECGLRRQLEMDDIAMIQHSSGSTGHPKPIYWTHRRLIELGKEPLQCEVDISRSIIGCHGTPMYHGLGSNMFSAAPLAGLVLATFRPTSPPIVPSPDVVWEGILATKVDYTWGVPSFAEQWSRDPNKVTAMGRLRGLMFGGAPLKKDIGDALAAQGVSLFNVYGSTEVGLMTLLVRENPGADWEYFRLSPRHACMFVPQEEGRFEIVVPTRPENPLPVTNTKIDGLDAYATSDIVERHPTDDMLWRVYGRTDDQIVLSNGEKTNPLPLEAIINDDPHVKACIIFGQGKFQNGVLVQPAQENHDVDSIDHAKQLERFRNLIWPSVERANDFAPQHSRIFKEMILLSSPSKPFQYNVKGLLRRKFILADYAEKIEALYNDVENSAQSVLEPPGTWNDHNTRAFVRDVVQNTLGRTISDGADIFRNGGDSLQGTRIRNIILRAIRQTDVAAAGRLSPNVVFAAPTVASLSHLVLNAVTDTGGSAAALHKPQNLWTYVEEYSANPPARPDALIRRAAPESEVVLITGTTGGFGCDVLEHLLRNENVERVYAFNRKASNALDRQHSQFRARGLDETLLDTPKFEMIEVILHEPAFGTQAELLDNIRRSVTCIIHNAWKVDFNLSISSFEVDLRGTRNLIDLALSSPYATPPSLIFVSSVGVFSHYAHPPPAPEAPLDDPASPFGSGYSESKWVAERVLQNIARERNLHTVVVRLGQVCGDRYGHWNEKEWFPALVKSARTLHRLPDMEGAVSWIPSYGAAKALVEMRHSSDPILHLIHPKPLPWRSLIEPIAADLDVPLVPFQEWLAALQKSSGDVSDIGVESMEQTPALRLLTFFEGVSASPEREPMGGVYLSTDKSTTWSKALANLAPLGREDVQKWLVGWKHTGFL